MRFSEHKRNLEDNRHCMHTYIHTYIPETHSDAHTPPQAPAAFRPLPEGVEGYIPMYMQDIVYVVCGQNQGILSPNSSVNSEMSSERYSRTHLFDMRRSRRAIKLILEESQHLVALFL